jgi:hypothetical protein
MNYATQKDFYQAVTNELKRSEIRMWTLDPEANIDTPFEPKDGLKMYLSVSKRFFVQTSKTPPDRVVLFVKWYTVTNRGLIYIGPVAIENRSKLAELIAQVRVQIDVPASVKLTLFSECETLREIKNHYDVRSLKTGTMIIVQPSEPLPTGLIERFALPPTEQLSYASVAFGKQVPPLVAEYLRVAGNPVELDVCDYTTMESKFKFKVPSKIVLKDLRAFVTSVGNIEVREGNQLLLFTNRPKKRLPSWAPLTYVNSESNLIFYLVSSSKEGQTVIIDFSADACQLAHRRAHFIKPGFKPADIRKIYADTVGDRPFRVLVVTDHEIKQVISKNENRFDKTFDPKISSLRVELTPDDQQGAEERDLLQVVRAKVDCSSRAGQLKPCGFPFFLKRDRGVTLDTVRQKLQVSLGESPDVVARYRFVPGDPWTRWFDSKKVLKKDAKLNQVLTPTQFLFAVQPDWAPSGRRRGGGEIQLKN